MTQIFTPKVKRTCPDIYPDDQIRKSKRAKVPTDVWQKEYYKASYRPKDHRIPPQEHHPEQPMQVDPSSDDELAENQQSGDEMDVDDEELAELAKMDENASTDTVMTLQDAFESVFKASAHDDSPRTYAEAMKCDDAHLFHEAAVR